MRFVVDTNTLVVANGRRTDGSIPSVGCRTAAVDFLMEFFEDHTVLLDIEGQIQREYRRYCLPTGEPGVGDRFYREVLNSSPNLICRVSLLKRPDGEFQDLPQPIIDSDFDHSDRKFAALAKKENAPVVNACDSDWLNFEALLVNNGIEVRFICGRCRRKWFF